MTHFFFRFFLSAALSFCATGVFADSLSPSGIIGGGSASWTNPHTAGRYKKYYWKDIQPTSSTAYDWSDLDSQVASAVANKKQFVVLLNLNSGDPTAGIGALPSWLITAGAKAYPMVSTKTGETLYQFLPWDPVWQSHALTFIAAFCDRYDGQLASVSMGGLGGTTEMHMNDTFPYPDGKDIVAAAAAWVISSNTIIAQYAAHLTKTPFVAALAVPFNGTIGTTALQSVVDTSLSLYGSRIGFENWGLNAESSTNYLPNAIIYNHRFTNPVGFQMTGNATTGGGGDLRGTLRQAMDAGVAMGAQYLQVYGDDVANPIYFADLDAVAAQLLPPPNPTPTPPPTPTPTATPTPTPTPTPSATPTPSPTPTPPPQYILNISTRAKVRGGDNVMIGGFIIDGSANKDVVFRALGPSLGDLGIKKVLSDPSLEVYNSAGTLVQQNDNWTTLPPGTVPAGLEPKYSAESVIVANLPPGSYTAILRSVNGVTGNALCELYDLVPGNSSVRNISTRGQAGSGEDVMIGGFIVAGAQPSKVMIRAIGPSLAAFGLTGVLPDPVLELRDQEGSLIYTNDNWQGEQAQQITDSGLQPNDAKESAIIATLNPGAYTAIVHDAGAGQGVALVEVYALDL